MGNKNRRSGAIISAKTLPKENNNDQAEVSIPQRSAHRSQNRGQATKAATQSSKVETKFVRLPHANSDVTVCNTGTRFNRCKLTITTSEDGSTFKEKSYLFQDKDYDFTTHFSQQMSAAG